MAISIHIQCLRDNSLAQLDKVYKYLIGDLCTTEQYYSPAQQPFIQKLLTQCFHIEANGQKYLYTSSKICFYLHMTVLVTVGICDPFSSAFFFCQHESDSQHFHINRHLSKNRACCQWCFSHWSWPLPFPVMALCLLFKSKMGVKGRTVSEPKMTAKWRAL